MNPGLRGATRLPLAAALEAVRAAEPGVRIGSLTVSRDPGEAIAVGVSNNRTYCVDPTTGTVREALAPRMRAWMQAMRSWHTRLNLAITPGRPGLGVQLNSAANVLFVFLGVSGLVLWWPRSWGWRMLRASLWFVPGARGKARDWNWHNTFGF